MLTGATSQASASLFCSAGTYSNGSVCTPASPGYYVALSGQTLIAAVAVAGGLLVTTTAALLPAQALRRIPAAHLVAEE